MKKNLLLLLFCFPATVLFAQYKNNFWCFGDSAAIDFNNGTGVPSFSIVKGCRGSSASICDSTGNLLFYTFNRNDSPTYPNNGTIVNANHQIMMNGDSITCDLTYENIIIVPKPDSANLFYVFTIMSYEGQPYDGIYYSTVDMSQQGGLGAVVQKNQHFSFFDLIDCITAIRHGNGRDWWLVTKLNSFITPNNQYYSFLISTSGISAPIVQNIGPQHPGNASYLNFSANGNKLLFAFRLGSVEMFDFDRCTGLMSNHVNIDNNIFAQPPAPYPPLFNSEFSPNGRFLYVTNTDNVVPANPPLNTVSIYPFKCYQYDLFAANIAVSKTLIFTDSLTISRGAMKLAPDGKIYIATLTGGGGFPYPDTLYNYYNQRLSYIENPNLQGTACGFNAFGFYLGGVGRSYWGLPNQLDYEMSALAGGQCDTITTTSSLQVSTANAQLQATYIAAWQKLFVNAQNLKGKNVQLQMIDATGKIVYTTARGYSPSGAGGSTGSYYTHEINCSSFSNGVYILNLQTDKEVLVNKFVKE